MIEKVELNGYHSPWLAPANPASQAEMDVDRVTWEAGLGATVEELEKPIFVETVQRIRRQMEPWGVHLPVFSHPKIGERSEEHTSELQSLMRISYAVFCLKQKT